MTLWIRFLWLLQIGSFVYISILGALRIYSSFLGKRMSWHGKQTLCGNYVWKLFNLAPHSPKKFFGELVSVFFMFCEPTAQKNRLAAYHLHLRWKTKNNWTLKARIAFRWTKFEILLKRIKFGKLCVYCM